MASPFSTYKIDQGDDETLHMSVKSPLQADAPDPLLWKPDDPTTWGPLALTGCKLWFAIKTNADALVLQKTTDPAEGITITDALAGLADVAIGSAETASLDSAVINKSLRLEVQVRSATGRITTLKRGTITILRDRLVT